MDCWCIATLDLVTLRNGAEPLGMYIVSGILFLIPCSLLWVAWRRSVKGRQEVEQPDWRTYCVNAALLVASIGTLTSVVWVFSWLASGGSPHGLEPSPGLWRYLGPINKWTLLASVAFASLGKGKGRFVVLGWAVADVLTVMMVSILDMD